MEPPKRKSRAGLWVVVILLVVLLGFSVMLNFGLFVGLLAAGGPVSSMGQGEDEFPQLTETWSYGDGDTKAVRIALEGIIVRESTGGIFSPARDKITEVLQQIRTASNDEQVRAIIMEIDSPGGAITPSDEIYAALTRFKDSREDRIVVVHMRGLAASGGYYVAAAGDWLIAEPTSVVGSIGVIMQALNWKTLTERIGLSATTIKSGENKDLLNPFEDVSAEQVGLLQEMIDAMYERFVGLVGAARGIEPEKLKALADGRILTADAALAHNLIDEIGYWEDVVARTSKLLDETSVKIVRYEHSVGLLDWFAEVRLPLSMQSLLDASTPQMMYLWKP